MTVRTFDLLLLVVAFAGVFAAQRLTAAPAIFVSVVICTLCAAVRSACTSGISPRITATVVSVSAYWLLLLIRGIAYPLVLDGGTDRLSSSIRYIDPPLFFLLVAGSTIMVGLLGLLVGHYCAMWRDHGWRHIFDKPGG
ncbi:hypothetical protein K227x_23230 [Rubripirellula lacrimiformis]|uniref:Uncharacterized protein n=1 Tax=Rubripirellula lacrimiformis TaxID=1930273 RepID=A0A517N9X0_9BACT|nr:hypothetical protein K227x_23230 [Rubripirellula lacrimiformis]